MSVIHNDGTTYTNTEDYRLNVSIKKKGGTYVFSGTANDMSIEVKKGASGPSVLLLAELDLTSSFTAPICVKKDSSSTVEIRALEGLTNRLTDSCRNNADLSGAADDGGDQSNEIFAESAVIKGKSGAQIILSGKGTLNLISNAKNAIKTGEYASLTIRDLTLNIDADKNGISVDDRLTVESGTITVESFSGDGIRSDPDTVSSEAGCAGEIRIKGGTITLLSGSDCIQSAGSLDITGGSLSLTAGEGAEDGTFSSETDSRKGLKAGERITITGGSFAINTPDDAIHSDNGAEITGGTFWIRTGDDGIHAENSLVLGSSIPASASEEEKEAINEELWLFLDNCYEGIESKTITIHSGIYCIYAKNDGINAAGEDRDYDYAITVNGGHLYVFLSGEDNPEETGGDGFDSNGTLDLLGGGILIWAEGPMDSPLDFQTALHIRGATVFGAGAERMQEDPSTESQTCVIWRASSDLRGPGYGNGEITAGTTIPIKYSGKTVFAIAALKTIDYYLYSSPDMTQSTTPCDLAHSYAAAAITAGSCEEAGSIRYRCGVCGEEITLETAPEGHRWKQTAVVPASCTEYGYTLYTCENCGEIHRVYDYQSAPTGHAYDNAGLCGICGHEKRENTARPFCVSFECEHAAVSVCYNSSNYACINEEKVAQTYVRDGEDGLLDISGDGQVNLVIVPDPGFAVISVTVDETENYKNQKGPDTTGTENAYRITKITGDLTVRILCAPAADGCFYTETESGTTLVLNASSAETEWQNALLVYAFYDESGKLTGCACTMFSSGSYSLLETPLRVQAALKLWVLDGTALTPLCDGITPTRLE